MKQKNLFVIFSKTPSKLGKFIRVVTNNKYNHVSICLDNKLNKMYSFARYNYENPLVGGFVEESSLRYQQSMIKVYKIPITEKKYQELINYIKKMKKEKYSYIYNTLSAIFFPLRKKINIRKCYTCIEFVTLILGKCDIINYNKNKFYSFKRLEQSIIKYKVYEGLFIESPNISWGSDNYKKSITYLRIMKTTLKHFTRVISRFINN